MPCSSNIEEIALLEASDELYLMKLLRKVLAFNPDMKDTFLFKLIKQQLLCLLPSKNEEWISGL